MTTQPMPHLPLGSGDSSAEEVSIDSDPQYDITGGGTGSVPENLCRSPLAYVSREKTGATAREDA